MSLVIANTKTGALHNLANIILNTKHKVSLLYGEAKSHYNYSDRSSIKYLNDKKDLSKLFYIIDSNRPAWDYNRDYLINSQIINIQFDEIQKPEEILEKKTDSEYKDFFEFINTHEEFINDYFFYFYKKQGSISTIDIYRLTQNKSGEIQLNQINNITITQEKMVEDIFGEEFKNIFVKFGLLIDLKISQSLPIKTGLSYKNTIKLNPKSQDKILDQVNTALFKGNIPSTELTYYGTQKSLGLILEIQALLFQFSIIDSKIDEDFYTKITQRLKIVAFSETLNISDFKLISLDTKKEKEIDDFLKVRTLIGPDEKERNNLNTGDRYLYNMVTYLNNGLIESDFIFEYLADQEISKKIKPKDAFNNILFLRKNIDPYLLENDMLNMEIDLNENEKEFIDRIIDFYQKSRDKHLKKWDFLKKRFQNIFKPNELELTYFALKFLKKYIIKGINYHFKDIWPRSYLHPRSKKDQEFFDKIYLFRDINIFEKIYSTNFFEYFEIPDTSAYFRGVDSVTSKGNMYLIDRGRIYEKGSGGSYRANLMAPSSKTYIPNIYDRPDLKDRPTQDFILIVEDTGKKTTWREPAKLLYEKLVKYAFRDEKKLNPFVLLIVPNNKFEALFITRLFKNRPNTFYISEIQKMFKEELNKKRLKKVSKNKSITIDLGYKLKRLKTGGIAGISSDAVSITDIDFENSMFMEYSPGNKLLNIGEKQVKIDLNYDILSLEVVPLLFNKALYAVKAKDLKKIEKYCLKNNKQVLMFDDILSKTHEIDYSEFDKKFLFVPPSPKRDALDQILKYFFKTYLTPRVDSFSEFSDIEELQPVFRDIVETITAKILNLFSEEEKIVMSTILNLLDEFYNSNLENIGSDKNGIFNSRYQIKKNIIYLPAFSNNSFSQLLFDKLDLKNRCRTFYSALDVVDIKKFDELLSTWKSPLQQETFQNEIKNVLLMKHYLNLDKEEINSLLQSMINQYLFLLEKKYEMYKKGYGYVIEKY